MNLKTIKSIRSKRTLHLIDIENLCGESNPTLAQVVAMNVAYKDLLNPQKEDLFFVTVSSTNNLEAAMFGWPGAKVACLEGHDGADILLANELMNSKTSEMFENIFLASGDGGLAPFVSRAKSQGCKVTIVSAIESLSHYMRYLGADIRYINREYSLAA